MIPHSRATRQSVNGKGGKTNQTNNKIKNKRKIKRTEKRISGFEPKPQGDLARPSPH